ncbi:MAG: protein kinase [Micrococcales bacterium]|nr:protein kinase [Micrococcales bacterium]
MADAHVHTDMPERQSPWQRWYMINATEMVHAATVRPVRGGGQAQPGDFLPQRLKSRYTFVRALGDPGASSPVSLYRRGDEDVAVRWSESQQRRGIQAGASEIRHLHSVGLLRTVDDPVQEGNSVFEFFEYCPGGDLRGALNSWHGADLSVSVLTSVGNALIYLHELRRPLVHRDVKPDNIFLRADGTCVLGDFELVTHLGDDRARQVALDSGAGTPAYAPPERGISAKYDWYSFGLTLVEALTGEHPYSRVLGTREIPVNFQDIQDAQSHPLSTLLGGVEQAELGHNYDRWMLLLSGLLCREFEHRWGDAEVAEFLRGGSPPRAQAISESYSASFEGYSTPMELGKALSADWDFARGKIISRSQYRGYEGPFIEVVRQWLNDCGTKATLPAFGDIGDGPGQYPPDQLIAWLLKALLPAPYPLSLPIPGNQPIPADIGNLAALASGANEEGFQEDGVCTSAIEHIFAIRLLYHLSRDSGDPLIQLDAWWRWGFSRYNLYRAWAGRRVLEDRQRLRTDNEAVLGEAGLGLEVFAQDAWELDDEDGALQQRRVKAQLLELLAEKSSTRAQLGSIQTDNPEAQTVAWFTALLSDRPLLARVRRPPAAAPIEEQARHPIRGALSHLLANARQLWHRQPRQRQ